MDPRKILQNELAGIAELNSRMREVLVKQLELVEEEVGVDPAANVLSRLGEIARAMEPQGKIMEVVVKHLLGKEPEGAEVAADVLKEMR